MLVLHVAEARLDTIKAPNLRDELIHDVEAGPSHIVLDLSPTEFMDSSGLGALVSCRKRVGAQGTLAIAGAQGTVARLFALARMARVFAIYPTTDAPIAQMGR